MRVRFVLKGAGRRFVFEVSPGLACQVRRWYREDRRGLGMSGEASRAMLCALLRLSAEYPEFTVVPGVVLVEGVRWVTA